MVVTLRPPPLPLGALAGAAAAGFAAADRKDRPAKGDTAPADVAGEADALLVVGRSWKGEDITAPAAMGSGTAEERETGEVKEGREEEAVDDETSTGAGKVGACPLPLSWAACFGSSVVVGVDGEAPLLLLPLSGLLGEEGREFLFRCCFDSELLLALRRLCEDIIASDADSAEGEGEVSMAGSEGREVMESCSRLVCVCGRGANCRHDR